MPAPKPRSRVRGTKYRLTLAGLPPPIREVSLSPPAGISIRPLFLSNKCAEYRDALQVTRLHHKDIQPGAQPCHLGNFPGAIYPPLLFVSLWINPRCASLLPISNGCDLGCLNIRQSTERHCGLPLTNPKGSLNFPEICILSCPMIIPQSCSSQRAGRQSDRRTWPYWNYSTLVNLRSHLDQKNLP
ncbi:hypothetical protein JOD78_005593 [Herbaspirillum sp. 1130]|nr:hypothetical protein [Herbaspirillum sp. 1130]